MTPIGPARRDPVRSVRRVLAEEAQRNEVRVAIVRAVAFTSVLVLDLVMGGVGLRPIENVAQSLTCTVVAAGVLIALRNVRYQTWHAIAIPVVDVLMLAGILSPRLEQLGAGKGLVATAALGCGLFAATGSLRFTRRSSLWVTFLAGGLLVYLVGPYAEVHELVYTGTALAAIGLLTMWLTDLVRRSMEGAGSQVVLARFLPPELVQSAFDNPLAAIAEPKVHDATVLVSDLRGFTTLAERMPPDQIFAFLSKFQGGLARVVHAHGGAVDKFLGDGMLAVFGATGDGADHARRAVAAAREIRAMVAKMNDHLETPVKIGIGIHSGPLVAGVLGSGDRMEWTVIGDTVNTASRLESMTKEHGVDILVTDAVVSRAGEIGATPLGVVAVRGREQGLSILVLDA